ncbi:DUF2635 domain-containing protein [Paraburkholderia phenoliruptrix]|uniref:DUF2635 domain-containing protein n=1 Tax=Paraburkholderia phenoliruptrix TaxID=252970 RepID=UPI001C6F3166|nr:DUF2635 domain-containing protein [Paraburkholderia phenoliruptrix]MBW9102950.1 DUF2635 domain-containing protein [Paraburkholderia phenoliruptrix]MBW9132924.1 DUF2635 domain-containing protein [Paraburkholderia ginsengiterrae]
MFVKPAPGLKIRDPQLKDLIPDDGRNVSDDDLYWHRRLRDGDVVLVEKTNAPASTQPARNIGSE